MRTRSSILKKNGTKTSMFNYMFIFLGSKNTVKIMLVQMICQELVIWWSYTSN